MEELVNTTEKMTSLVIAEITGKRHQHVMRDIRKMEEAWVNLGQTKFGLSSYINEQNRAMPMYELTKTECLYIATKFNDEARAKLVLRWQELEVEKQKPMSTLDMVQASIDAIRANQKELAEVKQDIAILKAKSVTRPETFTVAGYATLQKMKMPLKLASNLGRKASKLCKDLGITPDEIPDPRFGIVKSYPVKILDEVFNTSIV